MKCFYIVGKNKRGPLLDIYRMIWTCFTCLKGVFQHKIQFSTPRAPISSIEIEVITNNPTVQILPYALFHFSAQIMDSSDPISSFNFRQEKGFCCTRYQVCEDESSFTLDLIVADPADPLTLFSMEGKFIL